MHKTILGTALMALGATSAEAQQKPLAGDRLLIIAHRGASGYLPEHTLESYKLAIEMGADFIEPDLVATKDGVLIARHEPMLSATTDVAARPAFANRKTTRFVDGIKTTDWFACDFTLAEIRQLRAKQQTEDRDQSMNGTFQVPTLQEVIDLAKTETARTGRIVGIYPETKHPTFHQSLGLPLEDRLLEVFAAAGWMEASAPVIVQSFEVANLKSLRQRTGIRLVQLIDASGLDAAGHILLQAPSAQPYDFVMSADSRTYKDLVTTAGLAEIKTYADGIAPWKSYILPTRQIDRDGDGTPDDLNGDGQMDDRDRRLLPPTSLVQDAHDLGLFVHTWTFRNEPHRLAADYTGDPTEEYKAFYALGVDGVFSDFPDTAANAR